MEVIEFPATSTSDAPDTTNSPDRYHQSWRVPILGGNRLFVSLVITVAGLVVLSEPASAHGGVGGGGTHAAFIVVLAFPIVAGLFGGVVAIRYRRLALRGGRHLSGSILGLLLIVLGGAFTLTVLTESLTVAGIGGAVGVVSTVWITRRGTRIGQRCSGHDHLTLGAICVHRVFEGVVLGALYSSGGFVGLIGVLTITWHTAIETAAVGGLYASHRVQAGSAIILVQVGYASGAVAGVAIAATTPPLYRIVALALTGGILLGAGGTELSRSLAVDHVQGRRMDRETHSDVKID